MALSEASDGWQRVAAESEVVAGEVLPVRLGDKDDGNEIALTRLDGTIFAFDDVCPHAYALLSQGYLEGGEIECPLHAARFEIRTGKCLEGPVLIDLATYEVMVEGGAVLVRARA